MKNIIISLCLFFFLFLIPNTVNAVGPCTNFYNATQLEINIAALNAGIACDGNDLCLGAVEAAHTIASIHNSQAWYICCGARLGINC